MEDKKSLLESQWLDRWFLKIKDVDCNSKALWRETWISILGVPLIAWDYENFYNLSCIFGKVISVHYKQFDCAMVKICTDCMFDINCKISMEIEGKIFSVAISEKQYSWANISCPQQGEQKVSNNSKKPDQQEKHTGTSPSNVKTVAASDKAKSRVPNDDDALEIMNEQTINIPLVPTQKHAMPSSPSQSSLHLENIKLTSSHIPVCWDSNHWETQTDQQKKGPDQNKSAAIHSLSLLKGQDNRGVSPSFPSQLSPQKNQTLQKPIFSPIKTSNTFGPLIRPNKTKTNSSSTLGSSSCSGPLFPPGFEDNIPNHTKEEQKKKRMRKLEKKRKLRQASSYAQSSCSPSSLMHLPNTIQINDVIQMANTLGLTFHGPHAELERRIGVILSNQRLNWESNQN